MKIDRFEIIDDVMVDVLKKKLPHERLQIAFGLWRSARFQLQNQLHSLHPEWDEDRLNSEIVRGCRMEQHELLLFVVECLEKLNIPYLITGSVASMAYGEPRLTNDIDIVADIEMDQVQKMKDCFPDSDFYLEVESVKKAIRQKHQFNIIHPSSGLKIDIMIPDKDDFNRSRFSRTKRLNIFRETSSAEFAAPEDVIIKKLEYYQKGGSDKHLRDIVSMMKISESLIDAAYLRKWTDELGLSDLWNSVLAKLSE